MLNYDSDAPTSGIHFGATATRQRCDLIALNRLFKVCRTETLLLDNAEPLATMGSILQGTSIACSTKYDFALRSRFIMPANRLLLGYIHTAGAKSWCRGIALQTGMAFAVLPGGEADFVFGAGTCVTHVLMLVGDLAELTKKEGSLRVDPESLSDPFHASASRPSSQLERAYEQVRFNVMHDAAAEAVDFQEVLAFHVAASMSAARDDFPGCSRARRRHYLIAQRTEQFIRANLDRDIYVDEMCRASEVSERSLRYAFDDLFGISPIRFLGMLRLCVACKNLSLADVSRRSVKSVAMSCGLHDLSRFAEAYRRIFGELPHDTLLRSPPKELHFSTN